jgi:hypothetical protein
VIEQRTELEILAGLVAIGCGVLWYQTLPEKPPVGAYVVPETAKEVQGVVKQPVNVGTVKAYPRASKAKLGLPVAEQQDDNQYAVAANSLKGDLHPRTVVSVLDTQTGEVKQEVRIDPYPWLAAEQSGEIRLDYGVKPGGRQVSRVSITENLVSVKALHFGVSATLDSDRTAFAGVGIGYKW